MFKTRLLSGIVLVAVLILTVGMGGPVLYTVLLAASLIGLMELYRTVKVQNQALGGLVGILTDKTRSGLTDHTGTLSRTHAAQTRGQSRAQDRETDPANRLKKSTHFSVSSFMISTYFDCTHRGR